jgi:hypothetical protein
MTSSALGDTDPQARSLPAYPVIALMAAPMSLTAKQA